MNIEGDNFWEVLEEIIGKISSIPVLGLSLLISWIELVFVQFYLMGSYKYLIISIKTELSTNDEAKKKQAVRDEQTSYLDVRSITLNLLTLSTRQMLANQIWSISKFKSLFS